MQTYFGPHGLLAARIKNFEYRKGQLDMAKTVAECLRSGTPLVAEAGTGTGKTWAYLIPAVLSGKKVVVSTGTKTLQDQILDHDIPFLQQALGLKFKAVCLKGRRNYLCLRRFREFSYQPTLFNKTEAVLFRRFQKWAARTPTGDRAEIEWLPDNFRTWFEVCSSPEYCLGQQCPDHQRCHITRLRAEASRAQLLVVNHHLFFADLSLRSRGLTEVLPPYDAVIFDEAHQLEDVVSSYFGIQCGSGQVAQIAQDLSRECKKEKKRDFAELQKIAQHLEALARLLHHSIAKGPDKKPGRGRLDPAKLGVDFKETCVSITHALEQVKAAVVSVSQELPVFDNLGRVAAELAWSLNEILAQKNDSLVYWYESNSQAAHLHGTPIEISPVLREFLFPKTGAVIMTSATLSVAGSFAYFRNALGVPKESIEAIFPSPFDFGKQALLYVPSQFPVPSDRSFCEKMADQAAQILEKTEGRALFLFTSYGNMNETYRLLRERLPFPLLVQGQKPKRALLSEFKETVDSVLFATSSFWQGVDVPGEALSCLLIDKLPFDVPDDPITAARMERLSKEGKSPFFELQVPRAVVQLKQGAGRLIRSSTDRGIIAIFDVRLLTKAYGQLFLKSLPPCRLIHDLSHMEGFLTAPPKS